MKRILALVLVLLLSLTTMVGCDQITEIAGKIPFIGDLINQGDNGDNNDVVYDVNAAKEFIKQMYKDANPETNRNYDVAAQCIIDGVRYEVTWTVDNDVIEIKESATKGFWTVVIPEKNDATVNYKLTATIKAGDNTTAEISFDRVIPVIDSTGITATPVEGVAYKLYMNQVNLGQKLYALSTDEQDHKYIQTTNDASKAADFYVEKVDGGYKWYTEINGVKNYVYAQGIEKDGKISKYIGFSAENATVFNYVAETNSWQTTIDGTKYCVGTYNTYKTICISEATYITAENTGVSQFVVEFMTSEYANTLTPDAEPETITDSAKVIEKLYSLADGEVAGGTFLVTGVITALDNYGNPTIVVTGLEDKPVLCYKLTDDRFVVGATITVSSKMLKNYKGTYELMECTLKDITLPGEESDKPTVSVVDVPEVGVAYKLGLFHGNEAADVFFNGQNYNNYAWYLAYGDAASAVDVYLEAVEGAEGSYRLYFMKGETKTYIVLFPRDGDTTKGTLKLDTAVPTECYTYSTEYKTLIYTSVTGEQFYMGSSGTYKSISTSAISYITDATSYVSHFYTVTGGNSGDNGGNTPAGPVEVTIPEALAAEVGTEIIVTGTVESFYNEWSDSYGNCSVYIVDDAGNKLLAFRLATKVAIGDNITVTGTIAVYKEVNQIGAGCTAVINSSETPDDGGETPDDGGNTPADPIEMTVAEALEAAVGTKVKITGTVTEFYQTWNSQYSNVSPYITDDSGAKIIIFRATVNVQLGDVVTVIGEIDAYNNVNQIAQGNTLTIDVAHVCSEWTDATCVDLAACVVCGKTTGELADHVYVNGKCECGAEEGVATITAGKTMADLIVSEGWTSSTTKQSFNLDDVVSVKVDGGNNTGKAYNGDHIRIYATDSPAGTLTISVAEGYELVSVKVTTVTGTYAFLYVDGQETDICNQTVAVSGDSVVLNSVKNGSDGKQVRVLAIEVTYKAA